MGLDEFLIRKEKTLIMNCMSFDNWCSVSSCQLRIQFDTIIYVSLNNKQIYIENTPFMGHVKKAWLLIVFIFYFLFMV